MTLADFEKLMVDAWIGEHQEISQQIERSQVSILTKPAYLILVFEVLHSYMNSLCGLEQDNREKVASPSHNVTFQSYTVS